MLRVRRGEGCSGFTGYSLPSKRKRGKSTRFRVSPLSVCLSLSWSSGPWTVVCLLLICAHDREICLLYRFSPLIGSDWVFFVFLPRRSRIDQKIIFNYFHFWQISSTFRIYALILFSTSKKVSVPITYGECSRGRELQSLFCVYDKLNRGSGIISEECVRHKLVTICNFGMWVFGMSFKPSISFWHHDGT